MLLHFLEGEWETAADSVCVLHHEQKICSPIDRIYYILNCLKVAAKTCRKALWVSQISSGYAHALSPFVNMPHNHLCVQLCNKSAKHPTARRNGLVDLGIINHDQSHQTSERRALCTKMHRLLGNQTESQEQLLQKQMLSQGTCSCKHKFIEQLFIF